MNNLVPQTVNFTELVKKDNNKKYEDKRFVRIQFRKSYGMARLYVEERKTLKEIGEKFLITRERVRQLIALVLDKEQIEIIKKENFLNRKEYSIVLDYYNIIEKSNYNIII